MIEITTEWLSRRLGYGFSYDEELPSVENWIFRAKNEVGSIPQFDPWRLISKNPSAKNLSEIGLPYPSDAFSKYELKIDDLRYPDNLNRTVHHYIKMNSERERLRKLLAKGKMSQEGFNDLWWKKFNVFSWWRDTLTRGLDNIKGSTPIFNRFWHFWINHFALSREPAEGELIGSYYINIRNNLNKRYEDLLFTSIWHPAMQIYLNNNISRGPNSTAANFSKSKGSNENFSINENLAREILELYTVTPKAKYNQNDVNNAANILTGWGAIQWPDTNSKYFSKDKAEPGFHTVLGNQYGGEDLELGLKNLCRDLARNPYTANNIVTKLCRHFISDDPPKSSIKKIEDVYKKTNGDLIAIHCAVIDEVVSIGSNFNKFLTPEQWFWQIHKATKAELPHRFYGDDSEAGLVQIDSILMELGELHGKAPQPNGWADLEVEWVTPEYLDRRIRYASLLAGRLAQEEKFDPKKYAASLFSNDEELLKKIQRSESYEVAFVRLFCNQKFLRV